MIHRPSLIALALYVAAMATVGRFGTTDEAFFKAAGRCWAATGAFAAPELDGFVATDPPLTETFFAYPPVYPFAFGLWSRGVGLSWTSVVLFDAVIRAAIVLAATCLTAARLPATRAGIVALGTMALLLPVETAARPDELGACLALLGLLVLARDGDSWPRIVAAGGLLGLCGATSPGAAVAMAPSVALELLGDGGRRTARTVLLFGGAAALVAGAAVAPVLVGHPGAHRQLLANASIVGEAYRGLSGRDLWRTAWVQGGPIFTLLGGCLGLAVGVLLGARDRLSTIEWWRLWGAPFLSVALVAAFAPLHVGYLWGPLAVIAPAAAATVERLARWRTPLRLLLLLVAVSAGARHAVSTWTIATLPSEQRRGINEAMLREAVPDGSSVLTQDVWWTLAARCRVHEAYFSLPPREKLDRIEYVVLTGNGSGEPGRPLRIRAELAPYVAEHFEVVHDRLNRVPTSLLGVRLTNSAYGHGPLVLKRRASPRPGVK